MGVRERIWPGLTARGIALEAGLAGLGVVMIVSGFGTLAQRPYSPGEAAAAIIRAPREPP